MHLLTTTVLLLVLTQINGQTGMPTCGRLGPKLTPLVVQGRQTHHWPWHAAIYHKYNESSSSYRCGGSLIGVNKVLTAAHCVSINNVQINPKDISVQLGRLNLEANERSSRQLFTAQFMMVHQNFSSIDFANDIAIILLSDHATFNNYLQPICLWKSDKTDVSEVIGKLGTVVGWGLTETGNLSQVLLHTSLPVVSWGPCLKSNTATFGLVLTEKNFCAGFRNGTNVCSGDSGGSMTFKEDDIYFIRGIVSVIPSKLDRVTQQNACDPSQYAVFTDVAKYLPWIDEIVYFMDIMQLMQYWAIALKEEKIREQNRTE